MTRLADLPEIHNGLMFLTDATDVTQRAALGGTPWTFPVEETDNIILLSCISSRLSVFSLFPFVTPKTWEPSRRQARRVQGQTAAQPEGTVLNLVNWVGNVISPVGAALAVVMAVVSYSQGRGVARWAVTAAGLLVISGLTRLIEFWIQNGTAGVQ